MMMEEKVRAAGDQNASQKVTYQLFGENKKEISSKHLFVKWRENGIGQRWRLAVEETTKTS